MVSKLWSVLQRTHVASMPGFQHKILSIVESLSEVANYIIKQKLGVAWENHIPRDQLHLSLVSRINCQVSWVENWCLNPDSLLHKLISSSAQLRESLILLKSSSISFSNTVRCLLLRREHKIASFFGPLIEETMFLTLVSSNFWPMQLKNILKNGVLHLVQKNK